MLVVVIIVVTTTNPGLPLKPGLKGLFHLNEFSQFSGTACSVVVCLGPQQSIELKFMAHIGGLLPAGALGRYPPFTHATSAYVDDPSQYLIYIMGRYF